MSSQQGTTYGTDFEFEGTGKRLYAGNGDPNGSQIGNVGDFYFRSDCSITVAPIWAKLSGSGTNTGWFPIAGYGVVSGHTIAPQTGELAIVGGTNTQATGELVLEGNQAIVLQSHNIHPSSGTLTLDGQKIPTMLPQTGALSLAGNQPTVVVA